MRIFTTDRNRGDCGGTLVASKYVITAAHCMFNANDQQIVTSIMSANEIAVRIGDHDLDIEGETFLTPRTVNVIRIINHPRYSQEIGQPEGLRIAEGFDISILELEEELDLDTYTPACMATSVDDTTFDGTTATVAGWGAISEGGPDPDPFVPHEVDVPVIAADDCELFDLPIVPSIICAGDTEEGGIDACQVNRAIILFLAAKAAQ